MSEHQEQADVVEYLQRKYPHVLFWSTPNGARLSSGKDKRLSAIRMNGLKAEGLLPGVSDLIIFEPHGGYSAMFLEMKKRYGGEVSENQMWFLREIEQRGGYGVVAYGADEAMAFIDDYLGDKTVKEVSV